MKILIALLLVGGLIVAVSLVWRAASRHRRLPCPSWLAWMLDNPFSTRLRSSVLSQLELAPGVRVLDAGCGPAYFSVPIAQRVGPQGYVVGVDIQPKMLERARARAAAAGIGNLELVHAGLGDGKIPAESFDRALLVTVLGEIPDRVAALREIWTALVPGGFLLVTEIMGDPHYQRQRTVAALGEAAGFRVAGTVGGFIAHSTRLDKPAAG